MIFNGNVNSGRSNSKLKRVWDCFAFPGDNGRLEIVVLGETDVAFYHPDELDSGPATVRYGAAVAEYAESQVILPIAIRKSQVKASKKWAVRIGKPETTCS